MTHARVENMASCIRDGMEDLFDPDLLYFSALMQHEMVLHICFRNIDPSNHRCSSNTTQAKVRYDSTYPYHCLI